MNYNVRIKEGTFYLSSKEEQEGWEKNVFDISGERYIRYHKPITIEGTFDGIRYKDDQFKGRVVNVLVRNGQDNYYLDIPVYGPGKTVKVIDEYLQSLTEKLGAIEKGQYVKMFVNSKKKDKNGRFYRNIIVLNEDGSLLKGTFFGFNDAPKWKVNKVKNDFGEEVNEYDTSETNKFYIQKITQAVERFEAEYNNSTTTESKDNEVTADEAPSYNNDKFEGQDDLPF